jgi:hypothetical protein
VKTDDAANSVEPDRAASATSSIRVGIIGHVGNENLGDESIIAAVIQNVRRRCPDAEIFGFTIVPSDTEARHGIPSFPIRRLSQSNWTAPSPNGASSPGSARNRSAVQRAKDLIKIIPFLGALMRRTQSALESIPKIIGKPKISTPAVGLGISLDHQAASLGVGA